MNNTVKALVAAVCAAAGAYFRELLGPVLVLVAVVDKKLSTLTEAEAMRICGPRRKSA